MEIARPLLEDASDPTWLVEVWGELPGHHSGYARFVVGCLSRLLRPFSLDFGMSRPAERRGENSERPLSQGHPSSPSKAWLAPKLNQPIWHNSTQNLST